MKSTQIQDAVMRRLELKDKYPDIPWRQIVGMRDILIHEYFGENS